MAIVTVLVAGLRRDQPALPLADRRRDDRRDRGGGGEGGEAGPASTEASQLREQADQLRTRMSARVPVKGSLTFLDSRGTPHLQGDRRRPGAVDARAPQPHRGGDAGDRRSGSYGDRPRPVRPPRSCSTAGSRSTSCSRRDSIEGLLNRVYELQVRDRRAPSRSSSEGNPTAGRAAELEASIARNREQLPKLEAGAEGAAKTEADDLEAKAARRRGRGQGDRGRRRSAGRPRRCTRRRSRSR